MAMTRSSSTRVAPGEAALLRVGVDGIRQVAPVDEVVADGVAPVRAGVLGRVALVEEVPASLPEAQSVGVVQRVLGTDEVVQRAVGVALHRLSRRGHPPHHGVVAKLGFLLGEGVWEGVPGARGRRGQGWSLCLLMVNWWQGKCQNGPSRSSCPADCCPSTSSGRTILHGIVPVQTPSSGSRCFLSEHPLRSHRDAATLLAR